MVNKMTNHKNQNGKVYVSLIALLRDISYMIYINYTYTGCSKIMGPDQPQHENSSQKSQSH